MTSLKPIRISLHAGQNLGDREVAQEEVERTLQQPESVISGYAGRQVYMRRYHDDVLNQEMLLRVVVEETESEMVVVTVYKTSQVQRDLKGLQK
jgi:hypothetical protein